MTGANTSPPNRVLFFGASGHISGPAAEAVTAQAPHVHLRLATSRDDQIVGLQARFPAAEVVRADYLDVESLIAATDGVDAMFVVTPDFINEQEAMTNLVAAANRTKPRHIVRLTADPPHVHRREQVPAALAAWPNGIALNHLTARAVLEDNRMPVTFLNISAYYMDNFSKTMTASILESRTLVMPYERRMNYVDPRDVGEVAAKLVLSEEKQHLGKTYHLDNGVDCMSFADVAALMSEVFGTTITYADDPEDFRRRTGPMVDALMGDGMIDYLLGYIEWEATASTVWRRTDILGELFGMRGRTLRDWLVENKAVFGF